MLQNLKRGNKITISLEVKIVKVETIKYKSKKKIKGLEDFFKTLLAQYSKKPPWSKFIEIKDKEMNRINIFTGLTLKEKSNKLT